MSRDGDRTVYVDVFLLSGVVDWTILPLVVSGCQVLGLRVIGLGWPGSGPNEIRLFS